MTALYQTICSKDSSFEQVLNKFFQVFPLKQAVCSLADVMEILKKFKKKSTPVRSVIRNLLFHQEVMWGKPTQCQSWRSSTQFNCNGDCIVLKCSEVRPLKLGHCNVIVYSYASTPMPSQPETTHERSFTTKLL